ncbi:MAG TPA: glycosyltransferase family 2 protein [Gammaproteobacteria bacterium]|jgi:hypothetical protein
MTETRTAGLILNYRTADSSYECLESLVREGIHTAIVVDNSEDDGRSAAELRELHAGRRLPLELWIEVSPRNLGFAAGVNLGLRLLRERMGESDVVLINSDAKAAPGMLQALRRAAAGTGQPSLVEAGERDERGEPRVTVRFYHRALGLFLRKPFPGAFRYLSGCCLFIPAAYAGTALYDEDFFFYGEDVALSWRMMQAGIPLVHCPEAQVLHLGGKSSKPNSFFYEYHIARCHLTLARKLARNTAQRALFLSLHTLTLASRAIWRSLRTRRLTAVSACWAALVPLKRST